MIHFLIFIIISLWKYLNIHVLIYEIIMFQKMILKIVLKINLIMISIKMNIENVKKLFFMSSKKQHKPTTIIIKHKETKNIYIHRTYL